MSLLLIEKDAEDCWCQYVIWAKNPYWAPDLDENLISDEQHSTTASSGARQNAGLLEAALLSEKVYLYTINDCVYSNVQAEIFATLLPSELINQYPLEGKTRTHFVGILLFGDVSGFTALCEKYFAEGGKGGTYKLTATLNSYIGAMVDVIYSYGGDIIKFSGDAFLAVWKVKRNDYIVEVIHRAIVCAMYIQHSLGSFETDANVLLRVKLAISAGNVIFSSIGEETSKYYVIYGKAVDEVKEAQDTCVSGDVVLAPSAWGHCSHVNYLYTHKDEIHIKILRIIYNPWQTNRKLFNLPPKQIVDLEKKYRYQIQRFKQVESFTDLNSAKFETVRPEVRTAAQRQLGPFLRPYLIPPVVAQVDAEQPLDYLTEMRLVTTVFINVILDKKGSVETIIERVDEVYTQIWQVVQKQMGVVNKVCMFDKDIMFLVIFGLRGAHHEYNAMRSLKCAYKIRSIISQLPHVKGIACGVTVGMTYCGVVGHPLRQEYTVIGAPVNKAARLMMYFPNKVTCDQQTYFNSGLSPIYFTEQEQKVLKGIGKVAGIYEYSEGKRGGGNVTIYQLPPLLGRDTELQTFQRVLDGYEGYPCGVLYCGDKGVGKTRLLEEFMIMCVNKPLRIILITLQTNHSTILYYTIQQIFKFMLNFASDEDIKSRTGKIISLLAGTEYVKYVFLLTHVLNLDVNDAPPELFSRSSQEVMKLKNKTLHKLIQLVCSGTIIFIDNIEFCDKKSAEYLPLFLQKVSVVFVMTVNKKSYAKPRRCFKNVKLIIYQLEDLDEEFVAPLACQLLGVRAIPTELEMLIVNRSTPNPGWCQRFLQSLLDSRTMVTEKIVLKELEKLKEDMVIPPLILLTKRVIGQQVRPPCIIFVQTPLPVETLDEEVNICSVMSTSDEIVEESPGIMEAVIMSAFDRLSPFEQLLLKCGSVIGNEFSREMLHAVLFKRSSKETAQAIKRLFEMHILCCARDDDDATSDIISDFDARSYDATIRSNQLSCYCKVRTIHDDFEEAYLYPYYAFCNNLRFTIPLFRRRTYDLLPLNQKTIFHKRIAAYLELRLHPPTDVKLGPGYWQALLQAMSTTPQLTIDDKKVEEKKEKRPEFREIHVKRKDRFEPSLFEDIIYHYHTAGLMEREILLTIEYSQTALLAGCRRRAINGLIQADERLKQMIKMSEYENSFDFNFIRGKIAILEAQGYLDLKFLALANAELSRAKEFIIGNELYWYFYKKVKSNKFVKLLSTIHTSCWHTIFGSKSSLCVLRAEYFNILSQYCMNEKDWKSAKKASIAAVLCVLKSKNPRFCLICDTFANMIDIYNHLGDFKHIKLMETVIQKLTQPFEITEPDVMQDLSQARLKTAIMTTWFLQGRTLNCLDEAEELLQLSFKLRNWDATLFIMTILLFLLIKQKNINRYNYHLESMKLFIKHPLSTPHYYLFCLILHLYSGVMIKPVDSILSLFYSNKIQYSRPIFIVLGLNVTRRGILNQHNLIREQLEQPQNKITLFNVHTEIMYFELFLISLSKKLNEVGFEDIDTLLTEFDKAHKLCREMEEVINKFAPHLKPRLFLLKAYFCELKEYEIKSDYYIKKGKFLSLQYNDQQEHEWIKHNEKKWAEIKKGRLVSDIISEADRWIYHSADDKEIMWFNSDKYNKEELMYVLPIPMYTLNYYLD